MAYDGGGGEMLAFDLAHQVLVDVRLPRHLAPARFLLLLLRRRLRFRYFGWGLLGSHAVSRLDGWAGLGGEYIGCVTCGRLA